MKFSTLIENVWFPKFSHGSLNSSSVNIFDDLFRLSQHCRCLCSLDRHDLLVTQSRTTIIILPNIVLMPLLKLSQILGPIHNIVCEPLSILSDLEDKSQYYFQSSNVCWKNWAKDQFCHQVDFYYLQSAKKLGYSWLTEQLAENCDLS